MTVKFYYSSVIWEIGIFSWIALIGVMIYIFIADVSYFSCASMPYVSYFIF